MDTLLEVRVIVFSPVPYILRRTLSHRDTRTPPPLHHAAADFPNSFLPNPTPQNANANTPSKHSTSTTLPLSVYPYDMPPLHARSHRVTEAPPPLCTTTYISLTPPPPNTTLNPPSKSPNNNKQQAEEVPVGSIVTWLHTDPLRGGAVRPAPPQCVADAGFATRGEFAAALLSRVRAECSAIIQGERKRRETVFFVYGVPTFFFLTLLVRRRTHPTNTPRMPPLSSHRRVLLCGVDIGAVRHLSARERISGFMQSYDIPPSCHPSSSPPATANAPAQAPAVEVVGASSSQRIGGAGGEGEGGGGGGGGGRDGVGNGGHAANEVGRCTLNQVDP
jgi:hypothetical protein